MRFVAAWWRFFLVACVGAGLLGAATASAMAVELAEAPLGVSLTISSDSTAHTYDNGTVSAARTSIVVKAGEPVHGVCGFKSLDGRRLTLASARLSTPTSLVTWGYDDADPFAQIAHSSRALEERTSPPVKGLTVVQQPCVAAKAGAGAVANDWPILSGIVREESKGKGNFGLGSGTASQATRAGESWVGAGYRVASDGKTLVSSDGLRTFRPPSWKPDLGKYQGNLWYWIGKRTGLPFGNGHLDITDMVP